MRASLRADAVPSRWTDRYRRLIDHLDAEGTWPIEADREDATASGARRR
jgi:hypothetical protein